MGGTAIRRALLGWYDRNRRDLPWRRTSDPYRIWVSEVMLQQTTVKTAAPYYEAFLERFPTLQALAEEPEEEVLAAWSGLGYYHRARNLHRGAQHVAERHGGRFPKTLEAALAVPGVGLYTASAVLSIAHGQPLPVVDGNVRRVLARLLALRGPEYRRDGPYYNRAEELLDRERPGRLEPGADGARGHRVHAAQARLRRLPPARRTAGPAPSASWTSCRRAARAGRRSTSRWPPPSSRGTAGSCSCAAPRGACSAGCGRCRRRPSSRGGCPTSPRELEERHGLRVVPGALAVRARHAITFRRITLEGYRARLEPPVPSDPERFLWARPEEVAALPVSSSTRKLLKGLGTPQLPLQTVDGRRGAIPGCAPGPADRCRL